MDYDLAYKMPDGRICGKCGIRLRPDDKGRFIASFSGSRIFFHDDCFTPPFECMSCGDRFKDEKQAGAVTWKVEFAGREYKVCAKCDKNSGKTCQSCETRLNFNSGHIVEDGITWKCFTCATMCRRCEHFFPENLTVTDDFSGHAYCADCIKFANVIRRHDFNPMEVLTFKGQPKNKLYFGVELEVEALKEKAAKVAEKVIEIADDFAVCKHDGSLTNGFEVVTCPATLEEHIPFWEKYFDLELEVESYDSPRCGMHVHMSREAIVPMHLARMMVFMYSPKNRNLIETVAGRNLHSGWGERYAEIIKEKKISQIAFVSAPGGLDPTDIEQIIAIRKFRGENVKYYLDARAVRTKHGDERVHTFSPSSTVEYRKLFINTLNSGHQTYLKKPTGKRFIGKKNTSHFGRYTALNDTNDKTVEVRIFRGCNKRSTVIKNIQFCQALYDYCAPMLHSFKEIENPEQFGNFVSKYRKDYWYLYSFMLKHKLIS